MGFRHIPSTQLKAEHAAQQSYFQTVCALRTPPKTLVTSLWTTQILERKKRSMLRFIRRFAALLLMRTVKFFYHDCKVFNAKFNRKFRNKATILEVHDGDLVFPDGAYAIFLIFQPNDFPWYVRNALCALKENGINVVAVVNHRLSQERLCELKAHSSRILIRDNSGFDIGGYRDATLFLHQSAKPKRVIYLNDSVYFFKDGLSDLMKRLSQSDRDIVGSFENWEFNYHIQSFCFSVSDHVFNSEKFVEFWHDYLPVNSRLWAINRGEIGLSRVMVPVARSIETIYDPNKLRAGLNDLPNDNLVAMNSCLPRGLRIRAEEFKNTPKTVLVDDFCTQITVRSQIHTGGFLYTKFLQCPMMKRDLFYRLQFGIYEIEQHLMDIGDNTHINDILTDMRKKGPGNHLTLLKRLLFNGGII